MARRPFALMVRSLAERHPEDAARGIEALPPEGAAEVLRRPSSRVAGAVVERLAPNAAASVLTQLGSDRTRKLIESVPARQAASILRHLEEAVRDATLTEMSERAAGAAAPVILRSLGRDPAPSSSIVLTTVTHVVGFAAFLGFAMAFMPYLQA